MPRDANIKNEKGTCSFRTTGPWWGHYLMVQHFNTNDLPSSVWVVASRLDLLNPSLSLLARSMNNALPFALQRLLCNMRLYERLIRPFQAPAAVQNFSGAQVFLFRSSSQSDSEDSSEEEFNAMELRARGKDPQPSSSSKRRVGDVQLLERVVNKDDNLNKLALQYGCKVRSGFYWGKRLLSFLPTGLIKHFVSSQCCLQN